MKSKHYTKGDLTVVWKPEICTHSAKCVKGLNSVFDNQKRPWINLDGGEEQAIIDQVAKCPSGALSIAGQESAGDEVGTERSIVTVIANGPLEVKANCDIYLADGSMVSKEDKSYFCRCGNSANKPFCDGSHKKAGFIG